MYFEFGILIDLKSYLIYEIYSDVKYLMPFYGKKQSSMCSRTKHSEFFVPYFTTYTFIECTEHPFSVPEPIELCPAQYRIAILVS